MFYDEKHAIKACEDEPSYVFNLIKDGHFNVVDNIISNNIVNINTCDVASNNVMMRLLKAKQYDLVLKFMKKRNWNVNHQNLDGNTFGHILAQDNSVSALNIVEQLTKKKNYISNIKNNKGETVLDKAINSHYTYTTFKILEDKRFNDIDILSFRNLCNAYINNLYYGKYSRINNLDIIIDNLDKKELVPSMRELLDNIVLNIDVIRSEVMKSRSLCLDSIINSSIN